ncbi:MAG: class I SAM-dependent methyltransferase [bacterium]|nr:class I SAM-dependent methyltransferase [bacterium]MDT8366767.1 class I SAM-dependent methyltransferase [bacterium]
MAKTGTFDSQVDRYEGWFEKNNLTYESQVEAVRSVLPSGSGIEVGVGTGRFAEPLGIKLGVDPSQSMREVARKKGIDVVHGVAEDLPFPDESLDFVLMVTVICFFDDVPEAFREARRVLKPDGSLIVAFIDRDTPTGRIYDANKADSAFYREATFYSAAEVKAMLEEAGFSSTSFVQTIFKYPREMTEPEPVREGFGEGVFCIVKAIK